MDIDRSWTKPIIQVAAAGFGAAVAGPIGGAIGGWLGAALGETAASVIEQAAKTAGEHSAEKLVDLGADSLTKRLGGKSPVLQEAYQTALRQSLAGIHKEIGSAQYDDWFDNWDRSLTNLESPDTDLTKPDQSIFTSEDVFAKMMERLDAQGGALRNKSVSMVLQPRAIPVALLAELNAQLPSILASNFTALIRLPRYEEAWKEKLEIFQKCTRRSKNRPRSGA